MAQHDYNIANQTFPNTRSDLNDALLAVASNNSGTAAPSTTFANQWFYETDTNLLQIRNEDNDAYITIAELDQTNDTVEYFKADSIRTALIEFTDGDDAITIADGGACTFSGNISVSSTVLGASDLNLTSSDGNEKITLDASGTQRFHVGGSEEMRLTTSGLGIGTSSPSQILHVESSGTTNAIIKSTGSSSAASVGAINNSGTEGKILMYGSGQGAFGSLGSGEMAVYSNSAGMSIMNNNASGVIKFSLENGSEKMRIDSSLVRVGNTSHTNSLIGGNFDLVIGNESSGASGLAIITPNNENSYLGFFDTDNSGSFRGALNYNHTNDFLRFYVSGSEAMRIGSNGDLSTGGETAPDVDAGGITLDQNANSNNILTFKSSEVAHTMTTHAEADTYAAFSKSSGSSGGLGIRAFMETVNAMIFRGFHTNENTTQARTGGDATFIFDSCLASGTDVSTNDASGNMVAFRDNTTARVFITGDGDVFADRTFQDSAFDHYDDAHLVRAFDLSTENRNGVIDSKFDDFIKYNSQKLADLNILGKETDGTPSTFVNINGLQRLHNGAIWQQYEKHQRLAEAVYEMAKESLGEDKADAILEKHDIKLLN